MTPKNADLTLCLLLACLALAGTCSVPEGGFKPPTLDWKMMHSDVVLHGIATSSQPDKTYGVPNIYTVEFEVRCIYKGAPVEEMITVDHAGPIPGHCFTTSLTIGERYIIYLKKIRDGIYVQEFFSDPVSDEYVDEIVVLCETSINYPKGLNKTFNKEQCSDVNNLEDCMPRPVLTTPGLPTMDDVGSQTDHPGPSLDDQKPVNKPKEESVEYGPVPSQGKSTIEESSGVSLSSQFSIFLSIILTILCMSRLFY